MGIGDIRSPNEHIGDAFKDMDKELMQRRIQSLDTKNKIEKQLKTEAEAIRKVETLYEQIKIKIEKEETI